MISLFQPYPLGSDAMVNSKFFNWLTKFTLGPSIPGIDGPNLNLLEQLKDFEFLIHKMIHEDSNFLYLLVDQLYQ